MSEISAVRCARVNGKQIDRRKRSRKVGKEESVGERKRQTKRQKAYSNMWRNHKILLLTHT